MRKKHHCSLPYNTHNSAMTQEQQILELRDELHLHNYNYYIKNQPTISDHEFDEKMALLMELEKQIGRAHV